MNAIEWISGLIADCSGVRLGRYLIADRPNRLDPSTPVGTPMKVVTWGAGAAHYISTLPGFSQLHAENDPWVIVQNGEKEHVLRVSEGCPFTILIPDGEIDTERFRWEIQSVLEQVEEVAYDGDSWAKATFS